MLKNPSIHFALAGIFLHLWFLKFWALSSETYKSIYENRTQNLTETQKTYETDTHDRRFEDRGGNPWTKNRCSTSFKIHILNQTKPTELIQLNQSKLIEPNQIKKNQAGFFFYKKNLNKVIQNPREPKHRARTELGGDVGAERLVGAQSRGCGYTDWHDRADWSAQGNDRRRW